VPLASYRFLGASRAITFFFFFGNFTLSKFTIYEKFCMYMLKFKKSDVGGESFLF
jgi:hypothetical protein